MIVQFRLRRADAAEWATLNPILQDGEPGWEQDTNRIKMGDGETPWNDLGYATYPATEYDQMIADLTQDLTGIDAAVATTTENANTAATQAVAASTSAADAEAAASRSEAVGATNDAIVSGLVYNPTSQTTTALTAKYVNVGELIVNVKDAPYNAKGDGVTDDSAAIQAALNVGGNVYLPAGVYLCGTRLTLKQDGCLTGAGRTTSTIKAPTGMTDYQIELGNFGSRVTNLYIDGNETACQGVLINDSNEQSGLEHVIIGRQRGRCLHVTPAGGSIVPQNYYIEDVELYRSASADANPTFHIGAGTTAGRTIRNVTINVIGLGTPPAGTTGFKCEVGQQAVDFMHIEHHPIAVDLAAASGFQGRSISMSQGCTRGILIANGTNSVVLQGIQNNSAGHTSTIEENSTGTLTTYNGDVYGFAVFSGGGATARQVIVAEAGSIGGKHTLSNLTALAALTMPLYTAATKPAAVAGSRGRILTVDNGTGVPDDVQVAVKDAAGAYGWRNLVPPTVNVKDYGAKGDGTTDDTTAILNAWNVRQQIYFPDGTYVYNGPGLARPSDGVIRISGSGPKSAIINLGASSYLVDEPTRFITEMNVSGLQIVGGLGGIRLRRTGTQVSGNMVIEDVIFDGFTKTAVGHENTDFPYWRFTRCTFKGDTSYATTIGIALRGLTDDVTIQDCEFLRCRIGIKLGSGGNNAHINGCGFLHFLTTAPATRASVWVVPLPATNVNSGQGMTIAHCKFGPENSVAGDKRILYADADAASATLWQEQMPLLGTASTGFISGHSISESLFALNSNTGVSCIYSTTPSVSRCSFHDNTFSGGLPNLMLEFSPEALTAGSDTNYSDVRFSNANRFAPGLGEAYSTEFLLPPGISNMPVGYVDDIDDVQQGRAAYPFGHVGGIDVSRFSKVLGTGIRSFTLAYPGTTTKTNVADALGGADAVEFTTVTQKFFNYTQLTDAALRVGEPLWMEFDLAPGTTGSLTQVRFFIQRSSNGPFHFRRVIPVPDRWTRYRFLHPGLRTKAGAILFAFDSDTTGTTASATGSVQIGRCRAYHAREPLPERLMVADAITGTAAPAAGGAGALPATPAGYMTAQINGTSRQIPYY